MRGQILHGAIKAALLLKRAPCADNDQRKQQKFYLFYYGKYSRSPQFKPGLLSHANLLTFMQWDLINLYMATNKQNNNPDQDKQDNAYMKFTGMAFQMVGIIGVFAFAGYKIDESANHSTKWVTATLSLIGVFISLYLVIRSIKE